MSDPFTTSARWSAQLASVADALGAASAYGAPSAGELPSRDVLKAVVETLRVALFAEQLGPGLLDSEARRAFVRTSIEHALRDLVEQVSREPERIVDATELVLVFASKLPKIRAALETDLAAAVDGDPAALSTTEVLLCYPGFAAILHYRIAHELHTLGAPIVARAIAELGHSDTAIDIHPGAVIGERFFIDHGTGVVIGETSIVGRNVRIYQGVTLGARSFPTDASGHLIRGIARHPIVEDDVQIFAGATVLGRVTLGRGAVIGGGVWLTTSVPAAARILQAPSRSQTFDDGAGI